MSNDEMVGRYNAVKLREEIIEGKINEAIFAIESMLERIPEKNGFEEIIKVDEYKSALSLVRRLKTFMQEF